MISRRMFCGCAAVSGSFVAAPVSAQTACQFFSADRLKGVTPDDALGMLKDGNARMLAGKSQNCDPNGLFKKAADGQSPYAAIVSCMDSRASPEIVFDQAIGDIFVTRIAGNIANTDMIGSLEYAAKVVGSKAIVVMGHNNCGAIKGAIDRVQLGNLTTLLKAFEPALKSITPADGARDSHNYPLVQKVAEANVRLTAASLTKRSSVLKDLVNKGQLKIAMAMEDVGSGKVTWLS